MKRAAAIAVAAWWIAGATLGVLAASAGLGRGRSR
jgi:hypothetical protein